MLLCTLKQKLKKISDYLTLKTASFKYLFIYLFIEFKEREEGRGRGEKEKH